MTVEFVSRRDEGMESHVVFFYFVQGVDLKTVRLYLYDETARFLYRVSLSVRIYTSSRSIALTHTMLSLDA